jgi:hypothetical protein
MVTDVSAMFVATTIFLAPRGGGAKILRWSAPLRAPYSGRNSSSPTSCGSRNCERSS